MRLNRAKVALKLKGLLVGMDAFDKNGLNRAKVALK